MLEKGVSLRLRNPTKHTYLIYKFYKRKKLRFLCRKVKDFCNFLVLFTTLNLTNFSRFSLEAGYEVLTLTNFLKHFSSLFSVKLAQIWSNSSSGVKSLASIAIFSVILAYFSEALLYSFFIKFLLGLILSSLDAQRVHSLNK